MDHIDIMDRVACTRNWKNLSSTDNLNFRTLGPSLKRYLPSDYPGIRRSGVWRGCPSLQIPKVSHVWDFGEVNLATNPIKIYYIKIKSNSWFFFWVLWIGHELCSELPEISRNHGSRRHWVDFHVCNISEFSRSSRNPHIRLRRWLRIAHGSC